jgi:hypothetical protein
VRRAWAYLGRCLTVGLLVGLFPIVVGLGLLMWLGWVSRGEVPAPYGPDGLTRD